MGDDSSQPQSSLLIPLSEDVCLSNPDEEEKAFTDPPPSTPLRPRTSSTTCSGVVVNKKKNAATTAATVEAACESLLPKDFHNRANDDGETCSNGALPKAPSVKNMSQLQPEAKTHHTYWEADSYGDEVAVREDAEGKEEEEDIKSHCERESPSPGLPQKSALKSTNLTLVTDAAAKALGSGSSAKKKKGGKKSHRTKRRVRGLWGDDNSSVFSQLHDDTIMRIMTFFSMKDLCVASMVCERWKLLALHQDSWKHIDATDFVETAHEYYAKRRDGTTTRASDPPKSTSLALAAHVERYSPVSLTINSINLRLSPDNFLSSLPSLQELTLSSFTELTDTHVHVLLLSSAVKNPQAKTKRTCNLRKLALEYCPKLTNATVQSIGKLCPELEELSLEGNSNITDLSALSDLWILTTKPVQPMIVAAPKNVATGPAASMFSLFSPPPPPPAAAATTPSVSAATSPAASMFSLFSPPPPPPTAAATTTTPTSVATVADLFQPPPPPRPSTPTGTNPLQSLFAPPGHSPPRNANVISILPKPLSKKNSKAKPPAKLAHINVSNTGVTAKSLVAAWKAAIPPFKTIRLAHLRMNGTGDTWRDSHLREMAALFELPKLESLEMACRNPSTRTITDCGLQSLFVAQGGGSGSSKGPLALLKRLNLSGHQSLTGAGIAGIISPAQGILEELTLSDCKGLSAQTNNIAKGLANVNSLASTLSKCTIRETGSSRRDAGFSSKGLRRLSLSGCFSNQSLLQRNNNKKMHEETLGSILLESLGPSPSRRKKKKGDTTKEGHDNSLSCTTATTTTTTTTTTTLVELDLTGCWFATPADIASLRNRCPSLQIIHLEGTRAAMQAPEP